MLERGPAGASSGRFVRRLNAWLVMISSSLADPPQQQMRRSATGPVRFRSRWQNTLRRAIGPLGEANNRKPRSNSRPSAIRWGWRGRRFGVVGAAWFTGSRSSWRPDTLPAIGPFAQPGLPTYPLLLRDVVLVRAGNSQRPFMQTLAATIASAGAAADRPVGHAPGRWRQTSRIPTEPAPRPNLRPDLFRVPGLTCLDQALHAVVSASSGCPARPRGRAVTWRTTLIGLTVTPTQPGHSDQPARGGPPAIMGVQDVVHRDLPRGDGVDRRRAHVSCGAGTPSWYADYETKTSHLSDLQADPARAPDTYGMKAPARRDRLTPETAACVGRAKDAESARRGFRLSSVWGGMPPCADLIHTRPSEDR
jgi:hypothetical protein